MYVLQILYGYKSFSKTRLQPLMLSIVINDDKLGYITVYVAKGT